MESLAVRSMIPRWRQITVGRKKPYVYEIHLALKDHKWCIDRRYSDFYALHREIHDKVAGYPYFPPKKIVNNKDPKFVESRRKELETWLDELLSKPRILQYECVRQFLDIKPESELFRRNTDAKLSMDALNAPVTAAGGQKLSLSSPPAAATNQTSSRRTPLGPAHIPWTATMDASTATEGQAKDFDAEAEPLSPGSEVPDIVRGGLIAALGHNEENSNPDFARLHFGSQWSLSGVHDLPPAPHSPQLPPRITPRRPTREDPLVFRALSAYTGESEQDLGFKEGDLVTVVGQDSQTGWWVGTIDHQKYGLVPINFLDVTAERLRALSLRGEVPPQLGQKSSGASHSSGRSDEAEDQQQEEQYEEEKRLAAGGETGDDSALEDSAAAASALDAGSDGSEAASSTTS